MRLEKLEVLTEDKLLLRWEDGSTLRCGMLEMLDFHLLSGMELTEEEEERLREACAYWEVRQKAAALAAGRAMSAGELRRKLREKGAPPELAERAADRLLELGVLDEGAYAAMVARHYAAKGYGRMRVEQELRRRELPREVWADALAELPDSRETLDALVRKRLGDSPGDEDSRRKLAGSLLRRGYGWEEIRAAIERAAGDFED